MYSSGGLRRNGVIKSYNAETEKGWIRYREGEEFCEVQFFKNNIKSGFPIKDDSITFTLKDGKVCELWIKESKQAADNILTFVPNSDISHVITVYHPNIYKKENVILKHALKLKEVKEKNPDGFIYWGKIVEVSGEATSGIDENWAININNEIEKNKKLNKVVKLIITDFHEVYIAPLLKVHYNKPLTNSLEKYALMPDYYMNLRAEGRPCEVFFEISDLFRMERESLLSNLKFQDSSGTIRTYSPYESNITYPMQVFDEHYLFDDGNNFNPEFISHEKGAHFYHITNDERSHDEETVSNICMNLMDEDCWAKLPSLTRTYLIEAELGYKRIYDDFKYRPEDKVTGMRVAMSYLNAIESLMKDPAGHEKNEEKVPYVSFRAEFISTVREKGSMDFLIKAFFNSLLTPTTTSFESVRRFSGDPRFEETLRKNSRISKLNAFVEDLYQLRNIEAHSTTLPPYSFKQIKEIRNSFWGITTGDGIVRTQTGLPVINLLLKLYALYDKKNQWFEEEEAFKKVKRA